jgi:hypothetical protein
VQLGGVGPRVWIRLAPSFRPPSPSVPNVEISSAVATSLPPSKSKIASFSELPPSILPFRPLIELLSSLPWNPPPRQIDVKERLPLTKADLDAVLATDWMEYIEEAENAGVVEMDEEEVWVRLTTAYRPTLDQFSIPTSSPAPTLHNPQSGRPTVEIAPFNTLIRILRSQPYPKPLQSVVASDPEFQPHRAASFRAAQVRSWGAFVAAAIDRGVVEVGKGDKIGREWIRLKPAFRLSSSTSAPSSQTTTFSASSSASVPAYLHPLIRVLKTFCNYRASPTANATNEVQRFNPYVPAKVRSWTEYAKLAVEAGVVRMNGKDWIELTERGRNVNV